MEFRKATTKDIDKIMQIFSAARKRIAELGINQWQDGYPHEEVVREDIALSRSYVGEVDGKVAATIMIMTENEPTYDVIYNGKWAVDGEYLTIHRIALDGALCGTGAARKLMAFAEQEAINRKMKSIRVDTHEGNVPMRRNLEKNGYVYCGIIHLKNGDERVAYQKVVNV